MDPRNIRADRSVEAWFILSEPAPDFACAPVRVEYMGSRGYALIQGGERRMGRLREPEKAEELDAYLIRGGAQLAFLTGMAVDAEVLVTFFFFGMPVLELGKLTVGVHGELLRRYKPAAIREDCVLEVDGEEYFLVWPHEAESDAFAIVGEKLTLPLETEKTALGKIFWLNRIARAPEPDVGGIRLAHGSLDLRDRDSAKEVLSFAAGQLDALLNKEGSYLRIWDKYCAAEGAFLLEKARTVGGVAYQSRQRTARGFRFDLSEDLPAGIGNGTLLAMGTKLPDYLENSEMTFEDFLELEDTRFKGQKDRKSNGAGMTCSGTVLVARQRSLEVEMDDSNMFPPEQGYLFHSLAGDVIQMERKLKARRAVRECRSANPMLGLLIEEEGVLPPSRGRKDRVPALSGALLDKKIFRQPPTPTQEKAVETAINTPDIAIIQGPPGTGKTTVIAAIVERLNEMLDPHASSAAILLSSYQHDAVDNMVDRIHVNSLPTLKFGRKKRGAAHDPRAAIARWQEDLAVRLRQKYPELGAPDMARELRQAFLAYQSNPGEESEKSFLELVMRLPASWRDAEIESHATKRLEALRENIEPADSGSLRVYVHALRENPETYADDGVFTAARAVARLGAFLEPRDAELLMQIPGSFPGGAEAYFGRVRELKTTLLDRLAPNLLAHRPYPRKEIIVLMGRIEELMRAAGAESGQLGILADFIYGLENNPEGVDRALAEFNVVYASTAQQAEGKAIGAAKKKLKTGDKGRAVVYDTVIIDEAARCSPMDLLIPMSQGARRIILVGDHKQLPHMVEDAIITRMEVGATEQQLLKESMFEYLTRRAEALTARDHQPRFVTLDAQYRMHPALGNLVSRAFYDGLLMSPRPAEDFPQNLPDIGGVPAAWFDVPLSLGGAQKWGTSWRRPAEAREIVRWLKRWLAAKESRGLSFGVITFYSAQRELLLDLAVEEGLLRRGAVGSLVLNPEYADESLGEKLRINTVDAFQGKEFDIVLLSMVRSSPPRRSHGEEDPGRAATRRFGHLCLPNRLCVALSRQKRFLGVVGDRAMLEDAEGRESVPALANFLDLCRETGKVIESGGAL